MAVDLSIACGDLDLNRALLTGEVEPEGVDATVIPVHPSNRHRRFFEHLEFDVSEVSLASYLSSQAHPNEYPFTAIPVFPSKRFRHSFLYKHIDADVDEPADLAGKNVGISSWQTTANVWIRGILGDYYGLDLASVRWFRRKQDDVPVEVPNRFDIEPVPGRHGGDAVEERDDLRRALLDNTLDAAMDPSGSLFWAVAESDEAEFLFDDPLAEERAYFEDTGIHPPMHVVAIRDAVLEDHPWVATSIYDGFCSSRDACFERNRSPSANASLTWGHLHLLEQQEILGDDPWEHGLTERNRRSLETFVAYAHDQGLIPREYELEELFVDRALDG